MSTRAWERSSNPEALLVACPSCQAPFGEPCTQPTDNGRVAVRWVHLARSAEVQ